MRFGYLVLPLALAINAASLPALANDDPRIARMQQTIQELTLQLGDAIRDNAALRRQLDNQETPQPTAQDCEPVLETRPVAPHSAPAQAVPRKHMREMTSAPKVEEKVQQVCAIDQLEQRLSQFSDVTTRESVLNTWLEDHGAKCSKQELKQLQNIADNVTLSDDASALIDYYMSNAR